MCGLRPDRLHGQARGHLEGSSGTSRRWLPALTDHQMMSFIC